MVKAVESMMMMNSFHSEKKELACIVMMRTKTNWAFDAFELLLKTTKLM